jgi:hypothetical protein
MASEDFSIISVEKLKQFCNPFETSCWETKTPVSYNDVKRAVSGNFTLSSQYSPSIKPTKWSKRKHIERIAHLVINPDHTPIEIDVGIPSLGYCSEWFIEDGNHRFAAAIFRGDLTILATCSGQVDLIESLIY